MYINIFHSCQLCTVQSVGLVGLKSRQSRLHNSAALAFLGLWSGIPVHHQIIFYWLWDLGSGLWDLSSSPVGVTAMNWSHNQSCHFYGWGKGGDSATSFYGGKSVLFQLNINCIPDQFVFVFLIAWCLYRWLWAGRSEEQVRGAGFCICICICVCVFDCMVLVSVIVGR